MMRILVVLLSLGLFGAAKLPAEHAITSAHRSLHFRSVTFDLGLRDQIGQLGFIAALSGFRSLVADALFVQAHIAWERTEWGRVLLLFRQVTTLQPRATLFWDVAAWHMAWNASTAAMNDSTQPRLALRVKAQREYLQLGKDFLEQGIKNNPERPQLYEAMARLYRDKYHDHEHAAEFFEKAAGLPDAPSYAKRFAAYELSHCDGRAREAYDRLHGLYATCINERPPTLIGHLKDLEIKLDIPLEQRIPDPRP
jgi:hypothetical protein